MKLYLATELSSVLDEVELSYNKAILNFSIDEFH
jgi:hypothetical protein